MLVPLAAFIMNTLPATVKIRRRKQWSTQGTERRRNKKRRFRSFDTVMFVLRDDDDEWWGKEEAMCNTIRVTKGGGDTDRSPKNKQWIDSISEIH